MNCRCDASRAYQPETGPESLWPTGGPMAPLIFSLIFVGIFPKSKVTPIIPKM